MNFALRRRKVRSAAERATGDSVLVTHLPDVRYLTGFTGSAGAVAICGKRAVLFTDGRYTEQARSEVAQLRVVIANGSPVIAACAWLEKAGARRCVFQAEHVTVTQLQAMGKAISTGLRRGFFRPFSGLVAGLREVKAEDEISAMRRAADLGCRMFDNLLGWIAPGMTETEVALRLEAEARRSGAERMSFDTIVASGERSALPHGHASAMKLPRRGLVTLDFGVVLAGYCSDMTRTVHLGRMQGEERRVYDAVLEAQLAAIEAVGPGVAAHQVDEAARSVLRAATLDRFFTHSTGHGVGLEIHEGPRLAANQKQMLTAGMVITVEPGVYLPGRFGVRIEDMVLVTAAGHDVLTKSSKARIEL